PYPFAPRLEPSGWPEPRVRQLVSIRTAFDSLDELEARGDAHHTQVDWTPFRMLLDRHDTDDHGWPADAFVIAVTNEFAGSGGTRSRQVQRRVLLVPRHSVGRDERD